MTETVKLYISYDWDCPECGNVNDEQDGDASEVTCADCHKTFKVEP